YISGRTLKGLLVEACADIMESLKMMGKEVPWQKSAARLFGKAGSTASEESILHIGHAKLPDDLRRAIIREWVTADGNSPSKILNTMTSVRYQTAVDDVKQVAEANTLRSERIILKGIYFEALLAFSEKPLSEDLQLLSACIKAFYRAGSGVSRGRGRVKADLLDDDQKSILNDHFNLFKEAILA
ncbi:MAG: hypothetical protein PWQ93_1676, partial [Clostridiales bacterium]|nr:hypothetical protein [Clostridiales bacterium]